MSPEELQRLQDMAGLHQSALIGQAIIFIVAIAIGLALLLYYENDNQPKF